MYCTAPADRNILGLVCCYPDVKLFDPTLTDNTQCRYDKDIIIITTCSSSHRCASWYEEQSGDGVAALGVISAIQAALETQVIT